MKKPVIIAIDGFSACGKSTLARDISKKLDYIYIDSGAMYRAVTYYFLKNNLDVKDNELVQKTIDKIHLHFERNNNKTEIYLSGGNVESKIRSQTVSEKVSQIAAISAVRKKMVELQRTFASGESVVMDGRDIGTVVFPNADVKLFITADIQERTKRRYLELKEKGHKINKNQVEKNLKERDHLDSTREDSPLRKANDAILIDNTQLSRKQQLNVALEKIKEKLVAAH
jgi:cytidylate kinase